MNFKADDVSSTARFKCVVERTLRARSTGRRNIRLLSGAQRRPTRELS